MVLNPCSLVHNDRDEEDNIYCYLFLMQMKVLLYTTKNRPLTPWYASFPILPFIKYKVTHKIYGSTENLEFYKNGAALQFYTKQELYRKCSD